MSAARKRTFNSGSAWRVKAYAAINICWKQMHGGDREERLAWISSYLGRDIGSLTDLSDEQLGAVAGEMKRLTGVSPKAHVSRPKHKNPVATGSDPEEARGNVVRGEFGEESQGQGSKAQDHATIFLASPEQVYTLGKLQEYLGWSQSEVFEFIRKRVLRGKARLSGSVPAFRLLTFRQATSATNMLLHIASHRDLKIRSGGKPVGRAEVNKYIPILKAELRIDQR